ncbi:MAG: AtpZ/AtpI family protein [Gemmatimonadaceae bacterium]
MSAKIPGGDDGSDQHDEAPSTSGYAAAGLQFAVALVLFALGGDWLDDRFGTGPLFLLLGVFGGGAAGFYSMYRKLMAPHGRKPEKQ